MTDRMARDQIEEIAEHYRDDLIQTHSPDCWKWHPACAVMRLARTALALHDELQRHEDCLDELREAAFLEGRKQQ